MKTAIKIIILCVIIGHIWHSFMIMSENHQPTVFESRRQRTVKAAFVGNNNEFIYIGEEYPYLIFDIRTTNPTNLGHIFIDYFDDNHPRSEPSLVKKLDDSDGLKWSADELDWGSAELVVARNPPRAAGGSYPRNARHSLPYIDKYSIIIIYDERSFVLTANSNDWSTIASLIENRFSERPFGAVDIINTLNELVGNGF